MGPLSGQEHVHYYIHGLGFNAQLVVGGQRMEDGVSFFLLGT